MPSNVSSQLVSWPMATYRPLPVVRRKFIKQVSHPAVAGDAPELALHVCFYWEAASPTFYTSRQTVA